MEILTIDNAYGIPGISLVYVNHDQDLSAVLAVLIIRSAFRFKLLFLRCNCPRQDQRGDVGEEGEATWQYVLPDM